MTQVKRALSFERARNDVSYFYRWLGYAWGTHIGEWMEMYGNRRGSHVHRVCIIAPRSHSKSTTLGVKLLHQCLFEKFNGEPLQVWLFSASRDTAIRRLSEIRADLTKHKELSRYLDSKKGGKLELFFTNGAVIRCSSVGSAIRGEHPAIVALDDVLLDAKKDLNLSQLRSWLRKVVMPMMDPGSSIYCVGTPMSMNDLYHTEMLDNPQWKSGTWTAFPNWDEAKHEPDKLVALWPEFRPTSFLLEQRDSMGELEFAQELLCRVIDDDSAVYPRGLTRKNMDLELTLETEKRDGRYIVGFDPSHGLGKDYSVMVVMRQESNGDLVLVNIWRRNDFPPDKQADMIGEWCKRYGAPLAAEDVGFQRLYQAVLETKGIMVDYRPSKVSNKGLKQALLNRLRVWFERGKVVFPYGDDKTRRAVSDLLDELESHAWKEGEIVDTGKHNDLVMAFAHACDQFTGAEKNVPVLMRAGGKGEWAGGKSKGKRPSRGSVFGGKIVRKGRF